MRVLSFNQFDGGMVADPRSPQVNVCRSCRHFDNFTYPYKLVPHRSSVVGDTNASADQIANFCFTNGFLYGLGVSTGALVEVYRKNVYTNGTWTTGSNNASASGTRDTNVFVPYHGFIYGLHGGNAVWAYDVTGVTAFNDGVSTGGSFTYTNTAPGLVHSKDDILYIPYDNNIMSFNTGTSTWNLVVLTLPNHYVITNICEFGNYLAIGCRDLNGGNSRVYLWDRNSTLATLSETIDWGSGNLTVLETIEGYLVGVSLENSIFGSSGNDRLVFRYYSATAGAKKFNELISSSQPTTANTLLQCKQVVNNRLLFMSRFTINGELHEGVWNIGRDSINGPFAVSVGWKPNNDTTIAIGGALVNFFLMADCMFEAYIDGSSPAYVMSKTDDQANYNATSIFETTINPEQPERYKLTAGLRTQQKQILSVAIGTELLTTGQSVVVNYRVDGGAWTTVISVSNDQMTSRERAAQDTTGTVISNGHEFEFQFLSTGGAQITEFKYKIEPNESLL